MSGEEWAAVFGAQACLVALAVLVVTAVRLDRAGRELRRVADEFQRDARPLLDELRVVVRDADFELDRIDALVTGAESVTGRVDAASELAYRTITSPVVKAMAMGTGTKRVVQRLRRDEGKPVGRRPSRRRSGRKAS